MANQKKGNNQQKRNERERKRVHQVNHGFDVLRHRLRSHANNKKLSKADTLREAVKYISHLQSLLTSEQSPFPAGFPTCSTSSQMYFQSLPMPVVDDFDVYFPSTGGVPTSTSSSMSSMSSSAPCSQQSSPQASSNAYQISPSSTTTSVCGGAYSPHDYLAYHHGMRSSP